MVKKLQKGLKTGLKLNPKNVKHFGTFKQTKMFFEWNKFKIWLKRWKNKKMVTKKTQGKNENECKDLNCPIHGNLKTRGRIFVGQVVSSKAHKTAIVEWERLVSIPKYERKLKKRTKIAVHNPDCIDAKEGDIVKIKECRPISKTKAFVIIENIGENVLFEEEQNLKNQGKFKRTKKEIKNIEESDEEPTEIEKEEKVSDESEENEKKEKEAVKDKKEQKEGNKDENDKVNEDDVSDLEGEE